MRVDDTDPAVMEQRRPTHGVAHNYIGTGLTALVMIVGIGAQWGVVSTKQSNQEIEITGIKSSQLTDEAKLSELTGIAASLNTRVGAIEGQDIPSHFSKLDTIVAALNQQMEDQQKRADAARQERLDWQRSLSDKVDKLIAGVAHIEGRQDSRRGEK